MQITQDGEYYKVWYVTGPRHNFLALSFTSRTGVVLPKITALPPVGGCVHEPLDPDEIARAVLSGVEEANQELKTSYQVSEIQYVTNDTPSEIVYAFLAARIVRSHHCEVD